MLDIEILEVIGVIATMKSSVIELNRVSVNRGKELFDLGRWSKDGKRYGGTLFEKHQLDKLKQILNDLE